MRARLRQIWGKILRACLKSNVSEKNEQKNLWQGGWRSRSQQLRRRQPTMLEVFAAIFIDAGPLKHALTITVTLLFATNASYSLQIKAIEGDHALIDLRGQTPSEGDLLIAHGADGRKLGVLRVQKVIGDQALGRLTRGTMDAGWELEQYDRIAAHKNKPKQEVADNPPPVAEREPAGPVEEDEFQNTSEEPQTSAKNTIKKDQSESSGFFSRLHYGVLGSYNMYNQSIKVGAAAESVKMSGSAYSVHIFGDWDPDTYFGLRHAVGIDQFSTVGTSTGGNCSGNSTACDTSILYGSAGTWAKLQYPIDEFTPWGGVGLHLMMPFTKSSNAIQNDTIGAILVANITLGLDWKVSETLMIPLQIDYGLWPYFTNLTTSSITFRTGLAF